MLLGPSLNITLATGNCSVQWSPDYQNKSIMCTGPAVSYVKVGQVPVPQSLSAAWLVVWGVVWN